ncbi:MAG: hypothetical protein ACFCU9_15455 [Cyanophyceae cyanobacterium]
MVAGLHNGLSNDFSAETAKDPMHQPIESILIQAESRFLKPDELNQLKVYLHSWPERQGAYQSLRDQEASLVQQTLNQLERDRPDLSAPLLEICQKDLLLILRQSAMAMLMTDEGLLQERAIAWIEDQLQMYPLQTAYEAMIRILNAQLKHQLGSQEMELIRPYMTQVQVALLV